MTVHTVSYCKSWENSDLPFVLNQASAAPLTWPRLPCSSLYPQIPGSVPRTNGQGYGTKKRLYIGRLLRVTGTAPPAAGKKRGPGQRRPPELRPRLPPRLGPLAVALGTEAGHLYCPLEQKEWPSRKRDRPRLPPPPGSRKSCLRRWARASPHPGELSGLSSRLCPATCRGRGRGLATAQATHIPLSGHSRGIQTRPSSTPSPPGVLRKDTQPPSLSSHLKKMQSIMRTSQGWEHRMR
ncbi:uncharacterized protein LOC105740455 [Nomascus leucogenys]|uniref:uncharacterized protein LOC105740455 n=1 Tax=Nomascus leucogenys TaxID=61853 RepID=UPI00062AB16B|nr:uncharacterized protein LOC105740455 [Nomascus leucogenys]